MTDIIMNPAVGSEPLRVPRFQDGFRRIAPRLDAMDGEDLLVVNLDIPTVVTTTLGAAPEIRKLREQCARELPLVNLALFDEIETLALAMGYAHSRCLAASMPVLPVQELSSRVVIKRDLLASDCTALAARGLLDAQRLKELKGTVGYKNQAFDLLTLIAMLRENWPKVQGKAAMTLEELDEGEMLADQLLTAVGEREQLPVAKEASAETRKRAFTLFVRAYDQLRRVAVYLRWNEGDADEFVPSIYAGKKQRASELPPAAPNVEAASSAPAQGAVPAASAPAVAGAKEVPVGMPHSDPFLSKA